MTDVNQAENSVGVVVKIQGTAVAVFEDTKRDLSSGSEIFKGDKVITHDNSQVEIRFSDSTTVSQGENSEVVVDQYIYDPADGSNSNLLFEMLKGVFRTVTGDIAKQNPDNFNLKSPKALIGIRGTTVVGDVKEDVEHWGVEDIGEGHVLVLQDTMGNIQFISDPMMIVDFFAGKPILPPRPLTTEEDAFFKLNAPISFLDDNLFDNEFSDANPYDSGYPDFGQSGDETPEGYSTEDNPEGFSDPQFFDGPQSNTFSAPGFQTNAQYEALGLIDYTDPNNPTFYSASATGDIDSDNNNQGLFGSATPRDFIRTEDDDTIPQTGDPTSSPVSINPDPELPTISVLTDEDNPVSGTMQATGSDEDTLTYSVTSNPRNGTLSFNSESGTFVYTPNPDTNGNDAFTYEVNNSNGGIDTGIVSININPVNDAPISRAMDSYPLENTPIVIDVIDNNSDIDSSNLTIQVQGQPASGTVRSITNLNGNPAFEYTPNNGATGNDSFTYTINDGQYDSPVSTVTIDISASTIQGDMFPGTSGNDDTTGTDGNDTLFGLGGNDLLNGGRGNDQLFGGAQNDTLDGGMGNDILDGGSGVNQLTGGLHNDTFVVGSADGGMDVINDFEISSPTGSDTIQLDLHHYASTIYIVADGQSVIDVSDVRIVGIQGNAFADPGGDWALQEVADIINPLITADSMGSTNNREVGFVVDNGMFTRFYTWAWSQNSDSLVAPGELSLVAQLTDSDGANVDVTLLNDTHFDIIPTNTSPVGTEDTAQTVENQSVVIDALANDTDADFDNVKIANYTQAANGIVSVITDPGTGYQTFQYTPNAGFSGSDSFSYIVGDGVDDAPQSTTVAITVDGLNTAPVANDDTETTTVNQAVLVDVLDNDSDVDSDPLSIIIAGQATYGTAILTTDGSGDPVVEYIPNAGFTGTDEFSYRINDGTEDSNEATVTITVDSGNTAPVALDDNIIVNVDGSVPIDVLNNDSDADLDAISIFSVGQATYGTATIETNGTDQFIRYTPNPGSTDNDSFTYTITDGNETATATVSVELNAVPVADDLGFTTDEDTAKTGSLSSTDPDGNSPVYSIDSGASSGWVNIQSNGSFTYTPYADSNSDANGPDSFTYLVDDGRGGTDIGTVSIMVNAVNDAPRVGSEYIETDSDMDVWIDVINNAYDPEGDPFSIESLNQPMNGSINISGDSIIYTPNSGFIGIDSFSYTITDGILESDEAMVDIRVRPEVIPLPPIANDEDAYTFTDTPVEIDILANDFSSPSAFNGMDRNIEIGNQSSNGFIDIVEHYSAGGTIYYTVNYTPNWDFIGLDSFSYCIDEPNAMGSSSSNWAWVNIWVNPIPDQVIHGSNLDDTLISGGGNDQLYGEDGNDRLFGSDSSENILYGGNGDDLLNGGARNNQFWGEGGNDTFVVNGHDLHMIHDFETSSPTGQDTLLFNMNNHATDLFATAFTHARVNPNNFSIVALEDLTISTWAQQEVINSINSVMDGSPITNINGGTQMAFLIGNGTQTRIYQWNWETNTDGWVDSGELDQLATLYESGNAYIAPSSFNSSHFLINQNTAPIAEADDNILVNKNAFTDIDVLANDGDAESDQLNIGLQDLPENGTVEIVNQQIRYTPGTDFTGSDSFSYAVDDGQDVSEIVTVDVLVAPQLDQLINGTDLGETLSENYSPDTVILGWGGNDRLFGGGGNDWIHGGDGDDSLAGGNGNDDLLGGRGNDSLSGGDGDNNLWGGKGNDSLHTSFSGTNNLWGQEGHDELYAYGDNNTLWGGSGNDLLYAGRGNSQLYGDGGNDTFIIDASIWDSDKVEVMDFEVMSGSGDGHDRLGFGMGMNPDEINVYRFVDSSDPIIIGTHQVYGLSTGAISEDSPGEWSRSHLASELTKYVNPGSLNNDTMGDTFFLVNDGDQSKIYRFQGNWNVDQMISEDEIKYLADIFDDSGTGIDPTMLDEYHFTMG